MKKTKEKEVEASYLSSRIIEQLGHDKVMAWLVSKVETDISKIEKEIERELDYAKNETSSYAEQKKEARQYASLLKKIKKEHHKILKLLTQVNELHDKIESMY